MKITERINDLLQKIKLKNSEDVDMEIDIVTDMTKKSIDYVRKVAKMENAINIARFKMEGEEYRKYIQELDNNRRITHNALITDVSCVNRICEIYNVSPLFTGDIKDRSEVGDFAKLIVDEYFNNRAM